jgi:hypothetical protein
MQRERFSAFSPFPDAPPPTAINTISLFVLCEILPFGYARQPEDGTVYSSQNIGNVPIVV